MVKEMSGKELDALVETGVAVVCDFWAPWCGPCRMLGPVMEALSEKLGDKTVFAKVNADENGDLLESLSVYSIPAVFVFEGGEEKARSIGYLPEEEMQDFLEENLS